MGGSRSHWEDVYTQKGEASKLISGKPGAVREPLATKAQSPTLNFFKVC